MTEIRIETTISKDKSISINNIPFTVGDKVEVVIQKQGTEKNNQNRYPLRGSPVRYIKPFESVAEEDWNILE